MNPMVSSLIASFVISLASVTGIVTVFLNTSFVSRILLLLVSLSSGALMGGAFLHLLPEAVELLEPTLVFEIVLGSFIFFFFIEKILHWRHCHKGECDVHTFGTLNLIGDAIHNFIDGVIIAGTFALNPGLGLVTAFTLALHEIPQEIGDFGVLLYAGFPKKKALVYNFFVAQTIVLGSFVGSIASSSIEGFIPYLMPFAAGGFIYIAASDLIPEIRKEKSLKKSMMSMVLFLVGIGFILIFSLFETH